MSYARTKYTGPVRNRGEDASGRAKVSREELADFKAQYGQDKTLRDLLNADRTGRLPAPAKPVEQRFPGRQNDEGKARGVQGANLLPRQEQRFPPKRERSEDDMRARGSQGLNALPSGASRDMASTPSGGDEDADRRAAPTPRPGPTVERAKEMDEARARFKEMSRPGRDAIEPVYPEALLGGAGAARGLAGLVRGAASKAAPKKAPPASRREPVFDRADEAVGRALAEDAKRQPPRLTDDLFEPAMRREPRDLVSEANRRMRGERIEPRFKKGGAVKPRGSGCAQRGFGKGRMV